MKILFSSYFLSSVVVANHNALLHTEEVEDSEFWVRFLEPEVEVPKEGASTRPHGLRRVRKKRLFPVSRHNIFDRKYMNAKTGNAFDSLTGATNEGNGDNPSVTDATSGVPSKATNDGEYAITDIANEEGEVLGRGRVFSLATEPPATAPTPPPFDGSASPCAPTTGPCVSTFSDLQNAASNSKENDIIALCGNSTPIAAASAITIDKANTTLCCAGAVKCIMESNGNDRNLMITGTDCTLQDIVFRNGKVSGKNGGNVAIDAGGNHRILGCEFWNGFSNQHGGNLYVKNADSLTIQLSSFRSGFGQKGGGGIAVNDTLIFTTKSSSFQDNYGSDGGGAFATLSREGLIETGQAISFEDTSFSDNTADFGGGFLATSIGTLPSVSVLNCMFDTNVADFDGGAAAVFHYGEARLLNLTLSGNTGDNNLAADDMYNCDDFSIILEDVDLCLRLEDDFPAS